MWKMRKENEVMGFLLLWRGRIVCYRVEKQKAGLFTTRNVYWIRTNPQGWLVKRKISDFDWLASRLTLEFPSLANVFIQKPGDLRIYLARLSQYPMLLTSSFLVYFLTCTSDKLFDMRKDREYSKDWQTDIMATSNSDGRDIDANLQKSMIGLLDDINNDNKDVEVKQHIVLEDVTWKNAHQIEQFGKIKANMEQIGTMLHAISEKVSEIGRAFGEISDSWSELQTNKYFEVFQSMDEFNPAASYLQLKNKIFSWSNRVESIRSIFKKQVQFSTDKIFAAYSDLGKNLKIRREIVGQICYSARYQPAAQDLLARREEKLRVANQGMLSDYFRMRQIEKDSLEKAMAGLFAVCSDGEQVDFDK